MDIGLVLLLVAAYLIGSIPNAYLFPKIFYGIDIRKHGTGKVGASNVLKLTSKWMAILVTLLDIGKGLLAVWLAQVLGMGASEQAAAGVLAVIGHNWPVFLRFHGGRGIFTSLGVIFMLSPKLGLIILVMPYLLAPWRQVSLGVFFALASLPFFSWFLYQPLDIDERLPVTLGFIGLTLVGFFRRLVVPRSPLSKTVGSAELIFNRVLFDRDIRSREIWISQKAVGKESGGTQDS